jgi:secreted trypsin-like serine protease
VDQHGAGGLVPGAPDGDRNAADLRSRLADGYDLAHSGDPGRGKGGTCFGDSGGPVFLSGSTIIMGVTSFGLSAQNCTGPGSAYRTDQPAVLVRIAGIRSGD